MTGASTDGEQDTPAVANIGRRGLARLVDFVVLTAVAASVGLATGFGLGWLVGVSIGVYGYFVVSDVIAGATPGKRLLGIRVVSSSGSPTSWRSAAIREAFVLVGAIQFAGPVLALVAWGAIFQSARTDPEGAGFHDRLGETRVVADRPGPPDLDRSR